MVTRDSLISIGTLVVGTALGLIGWIGRRYNIKEARFDSKTGKEIE